MANTLKLSKSQIETIVLEAMQAGAEAMAHQLDADNVAKEVNKLVNSEGEGLIDNITSSTMSRYGNASCVEGQPLPQYKEQFGRDFNLGFDLSDFPELVDNSYRHDCCPCFSFRVGEQHYMLYTDYEIKRRRENDEARYAIITAHNEGDDQHPDIIANNTVPLFETEEPYEIIKKLKSMLNK